MKKGEIRGMFGKADNFSKGMLKSIYPIERDIKGGKKRTIIIMEITAKPTFERMTKAERWVKRAMNKRNRALGKGEFDFENSRDNRVLLTEFKVKFTNKATSSKRRDSMATKMETEDRIMTITEMGTGFRITAKKERIKDIVPGNRRKRRKRRKRGIESGVEGGKTGLAMRRIKKENFNTSRTKDNV